MLSDVSVAGQVDGLSDIAPTGSRNSRATDVNNSGHIVGLLHTTKPTSEDHGLLLMPNLP